MYGKLAVAAGFAAGYVLGSKAGRQRYEEIVSQARKVAGNDTVQSTAGVLQAKGTDLVEKAKQSDIANKVKSTVGKDKGSSSPDSGTTTTYETTTYEATPTTDLFEDTTTSADPLVSDPLATDPLRTNVNGTS
jgi:hypothetical protein